MIDIRLDQDRLQPLRALVHHTPYSNATVLVHRKRRIPDHEIPASLSSDPKHCADRAIAPYVMWQVMAGDCPEIGISPFWHKNMVC